MQRINTLAQPTYSVHPDEFEGAEHMRDHRFSAETIDGGVLPLRRHGLSMRAASPRPRSPNALNRAQFHHPRQPNEVEMITDDNDDFLNAARRQRGALPSVEHLAEIVPGSVLPFTIPQTRGCAGSVNICAGDHCGRVIRLRFLEDGAPSLDGIIARDIEALASWQKTVGAEPSPPQDGIAGVLKAIWKASQGKDVLLRLMTTTRKDGALETILLSARCEDGV